ncbi:DUF58 domain-containing protein [Actinophytocola sp.]|uniref:DUF58 domain-containing protein n=1 Tax=Actinophytocola sp. TaxID=1872138 RepID=UPI003D6A208D
MSAPRGGALPGPFTAAGWSLLVGCLVGYPAGVVLGYRLLIMLAIGGLALLVLAGALVVVRPRVALHRTVRPDRVTVGEPSWGKLVARNQSRWPAPSFLAVDRVGEHRVELAVPLIAGAGRRTLRYPIRAQRRGRLPLGPLTVERRDPLGLCCRAQRLADELTLWVYPVVHPARPLPVGTVPDFEGRRAQTRGGTVTFSSLREYERGDDPRRIHWRTTARTGVLMVREQVDTTEPNTTVVLDTRRTALPPDGFEHAAEVAASVAQAAVYAGRPATLLLPGEVAGAGTAPLLDRLAMVEQHDETTETLLVTVERATAGGALVVITGAREPALVARLGAQRRRFSPVVVVTVTAPGDPAVPLHRRPGMAVLAAPTGADAVAAWDRMVLGDGG